MGMSWLFGKKCWYCEKRIPRNYKPIIDNYLEFCSQLCADYFERSRILYNSRFNFSEDQLDDKLTDLRREFKEQRKLKRFD